MKIKAVRSLLWVLNVIFLLGLLGLLYLFYQSRGKERGVVKDDDIKQQVINPLVEELRKNESKDSTGVVDKDVYKSLYTLVLDGTVEKPPVVEQQPDKPVEPVKPKTRPLSDIIKLIAVYVDEGRPELSSATVQFAAGGGGGGPVGGQANSMKLVRIGAELENVNPKAVLKEVREFSVLFEYDSENEANNLVEMSRRSPWDVSNLGGTRQEPILGRDPGSVAARRNGQGGRRGPGRGNVQREEIQKPEAPEQTELRNGVWHISQSDNDTISQNHESMIQQLGVRDYEVNGEKKGLEVQTVPNESLAQKVGIQPGDVVQKVNGRDVTSQAAAINTIRNQPPGLVNVTVLRKGQTVQLRFYTY